VHPNPFSSNLRTSPAAFRPLRGPETSPRINKGTSGLGKASSAPRFVSYVKSHQPIVNHSQGLSRLLSQPRGRYDVIRPAPPAPDQHLAIDDQALGSGRPRPARQRNRAACTADKVFVITPDRQLERMARAQIDDRCRRMGMPIVRSLVCVRVMAECLRQVRPHPTYCRRLACFKAAAVAA
jgi:hypothetical protein